MMKTINYTKRFAIALLLIFNVVPASTQTIVAKASSVQSCGGEIVVPLVVTNIINISAISLTLNYDSNILSYDSFQNEQEELSTGYLIVNSNGTQVIVSWFSLTSANFGDDTLVELKFNALDKGLTNLTWDLTYPDNCLFTDANYNDINAIYVDGSISIEDCSNIYGNVTYDNYSTTAMNNTNIELETLYGDMLDATVTDVNGEFVFDSLVSGTYTFGVSSNKTWGGANATDALGIMRHFVFLDTLYNIRLAAGDVDASGFINTLDALATMQRFTLLITSFPAGDWCFAADTVNLLAGNDTTAEIKALCYGDIDGSYIPPFVKISPEVRLTSSSIINAGYNEALEVPVKVTQDMIVGAVSLVINYPSQDLDILDVKLKDNNDASNLVYSKVDGALRIAWCDINPLQVLADEEIFVLSCKLKNPKAEEIEFSIDAGCEFADEEANVINDVNIEMPKIVTVADQTRESFQYQVYPNPANDIVNIEVTIPEDAEISLKLIDILGRCHGDYKQLLNRGSIKIPIDVSGISNGIYYLKMKATGLKGEYTYTEGVILER